MKTVKELTEELEVLYQHVATENSDNLSIIEEDLPGHPDDSTHDAGDEGNNGSDDNSGREQRKKKMSVPLWVSLGFSGLLIIAACVFFLAPLLQDKDLSQDESHVLTVKTFRAPIAAITEGYTSPEVTEAIKKPDAALNATTSEEEIEASVGHMLRAFEVGTPPHGGIALGLDRLMMILTGETSIKEVVAFPMTSTGRTAVMSAPSEVELDLLDELGLEIKK